MDACLIAQAWAATAAGRGGAGGTTGPDPRHRAGRALPSRFPVEDAAVVYGGDAPEWTPDLEQQG